MPNYCGNDIHIMFTDPREYDKFITKMGVQDSTSPYLEYEAEKKGYGFFDRLVPTPAQKLKGDGWYEWRIEHWGTKWNPMVHHFNTNDDGLTIELSMDTAWAPPKEFFVTFSEMFPSAEITLVYLEEGMNFGGRAFISRGMCSDIYLNDIPVEMYVAAGATLNADGEVDWEVDQDYDLWSIMSDEVEFMKFV